MPANILTIVERAYHGTLEEQDDTVLWFNSMLLGKGPSLGFLLRGNAVNYAIAAQDASGLTIGGESFGKPPEIPNDVRLLLDKGAPVFAIVEDIDERGIPRERLLPGIKEIHRADLAPLLDQYDTVWHW